MAHIEKTKAGRYRARWRTPNGDGRSKTFDRKVDAQRHLTTVESSKMVGSYVDPGAGRTLFGDWVKDWRAGIVDLRPSTLARDDGYVERYIMPTFSRRRLADIDHSDIRAWVADLNARGLAPATVTKAGQILGKIMATAVRAGKIPASPVTGVRLPRIEREEMRFLSPTEIDELADAIHPRYRALVILGAYSGLRIGEMLGLRVDRIDPVRGRIDVAETLVEVSGELHFGPPKTRAGRRAVPVPRLVRDVLDEHLKAYAAAPGEPVFRAPEGGPVRLASWRRRQWRPAVEAAGVAPLRPHDLRHTAVALWIAAGATPKEIATRAGHSSVVTVLDRYGHLLPGSEERVNDALDALAATARPPASRPGSLRTLPATDSTA